MAQRRMFSLKVIDTDLFLEMPQSTRLLYYELCMRADDDGFVASPKKIMKMTGCSEDDFKILMAKQYIIPFESGVCVIKHWRVHNIIRADRYTETEYKQEKSMLIQEDNKYVIPNDNQMETQVRLGKDRLDKVSLDISVDKPQTHKFTIPTLEEVKAYCNERNNNIDAEIFIDFYTSKGWMIGKNKMKDWQSAIRTWERKNKDNPQPQQQYKKQPITNNASKRQYDANELEKMLLGRQ